MKTKTAGCFTSGKHSSNFVLQRSSPVLIALNKGKHPPYKCDKVDIICRLKAKGFLLI